MIFNGSGGRKSPGYGLKMTCRLYCKSGK